MSAEKVTIELPRFLVDLPLVGGYIRWSTQLIYDNPIHLLVESTLILLVLYILFKRPGKKASKLEQLPAHVIQELIDEFEPEPLCPDLSKSAELVLNDYVVLDEKPNKWTRVRGYNKPMLNMATMDFCGLGQRDEITKAAHLALDKYGCGSCGPRGFYGTIDVHVYLEQDLAKFYGTEEAIVYSDASSTASSAIPAFSNRADLLVVDDGVNDSILTGVNLSRSRVLFFKHNDMEDLRNVLKKVKDEDTRLKRKPQRRFIVVEGLYRNFGDIVPLDELFKLKQEFRWRLFLDESHSIGCFGATGRGVHEHFGVPIKEIDLVISSLSTSLASVGGFCVGSREVVEHQRLAAAGYCFSASSPPFVSTAASAAVKVLEEEAKSRITPSVKRKAMFLHGEINKLCSGLLRTTSNPASPLVHVRLDSNFTAASSRAEYDEAKRIQEETVLRSICRAMREKGFLCNTANHIFNTQVSQKIGSSPRPSLPEPSIRLSVTAVHEESELENFSKALAECAKAATADMPPKAAASTSSNASDDGLKKRR